MGRASRRKRERRELGGLNLPRHLTANLADIRVRVNRNPRKISESLVELIRPFTCDHMNLKDYRSLVGLAAVAWNLSLLEDSSPAGAFGFLEDAKASDREWLESFVSELVSRKRILFPGDERSLAAWDVVLRPDGTFFITAAAVSTE